jgi:hypothetical protein
MHRQQVVVLDLLVRRERKVQQELQVLQDQLALLVRQDHKVQLAQLVLRDQVEELLAQLDHKEQQELQAQRALPAQQVQLEVLEPQVQRDLKVMLVLPAQQVPRVQQDQRECLKLVSYPLQISH